MLLLKTKSVVMDVIHNVDMIDQLLAAQQEGGGQISANDWVWQKQLRFYMEVTEHSGQICRARMCDASFDYTYEYQGNAPRLVHTPLTDKCYLTLTQVRKRHFLSTFYIKMIILPRQARDKHKKNSKKVPFSSCHDLS